MRRRGSKSAGEDLRVPVRIQPSEIVEMSLSVSLLFIFSDLLMMKNTKTATVPTVVSDAKIIEAIAYNIAVMA
jgi:hypothetical protein